MAESALGKTLRLKRVDDLTVAVKEQTNNMDISRELGMDASMHKAEMNLLAITEPEEYQRLKKADLVTIKTNLDSQFNLTFAKYWATGMRQPEAKALATKVCENLQNSLMDIHYEDFPPSSDTVKMKAFTKKAHNEKLKGVL